MKKYHNSIQVYLALWTWGLQVFVQGILNVVIDSLDRKKVAVITNYAIENFTESNWFELGQITGKLSLINGHPRLLRSMGFGDPDYEYCVAEVINEIIEANVSLIVEIIEHFDIDLWYENKAPEKYRRVFLESARSSADFWDDGFFKIFVSHLSKSKKRMAALKANLSKWGVSAFVAHEDIEPTKEWMREVEAGLETMELLVAVVELGFKDSDWCSQEVGYALGRRVDIIPLRAGMDPYGFFGKYQGIQVKGKFPIDVSHELVQLLLKKPKHRDRMLQCISRGFSALQSEVKLGQFNYLESWAILTDEQMKKLLEQSSLTRYEKDELSVLIERVKAFKFTEIAELEPSDDDVPF